MSSIEQLRSLLGEIQELEIRLQNDKSEAYTLSENHLDPEHWPRTTL